MAAEIGFLDSTHLQNITQSQQQQQPQVVQFNPSPNSSSSWMWNNKNKQTSRDDEDDSWEVKAFEEDTANILGATWPPRSYACTFCRREFRSAQALGGHMNVHRRDRARLHQTPIGLNKSPSSSNAPPFLIPPQEFVTGGGLCFLYSLPAPNGLLAPTMVNSPLGTNDLASQSMTFQLTPHSIYHASNQEPQSYSINSSVCHNNNTENATSQVSHHENHHQHHKEDSNMEEIDLELRLGRRSP